MIMLVQLLWAIFHFAGFYLERLKDRALLSIGYRRKDKSAQLYHSIRFEEVSLSLSQLVNLWRSIKQHINSSSIKHESRLSLTLVLSCWQQRTERGRERQQGSCLCFDFCIWAQVVRTRALTCVGRRTP